MWNRRLTGGRNEGILIFRFIQKRTDKRRPFLRLNSKVRHTLADILVLATITVLLGIVEYKIFGLASDATFRIRGLSGGFGLLYGLWSNYIHRRWSRGETTFHSRLADAFAFASFHAPTYPLFLWWNGASIGQISFMFLLILATSWVAGPILGWCLTTARTWSDRLTRQEISIEEPSTERKIA